MCNLRRDHSTFHLRLLSHVPINVPKQNDIVSKLINFDRSLNWIKIFGAFFSNFEYDYEATNEGQVLPFTECCTSYF